MANDLKQRSAKAPNPYLVQQVQTASPEKLIQMLYEVGMKACHNKDRAKVGKVLAELISALDFDYKDVALSYFNLYRYALDEANKNNFRNTHMVLEGLSEAWQHVMNRTERLTDQSPGHYAKQ